MREATTKPVVIGCGVAGLALSRSLSRARVPHQLVGDPPGDGLRPGESLDLPASCLVRLLFPSLASHFHPKRRVVVELGHPSEVLSVAACEKASTDAVLRIIGLPPSPYLLHVDRVGFDGALFREVVASPCCEHLPGRVEDIDYDADADRIVALVLPDGRRVTPSFVFDGAGPARVLGRATGQEAERTEGLQHGVLAHVRTPPNAGAWRIQTTIGRLFEAQDGVHGGFWCIPIGDTVSVGVSTERPAEGVDLLDTALAALRRIGVPLEEVQRSLPARWQHYRYARSVGANWALAGTASAQIWWPTSAGLGGALAAAVLAPDLARGDARAKRLLQAYHAELMTAHARAGSIMAFEQPPDLEALRPLVSTLVRANMLRTLVVCQGLGRRPSRWTARLLYRVVDSGVGSINCDRGPTSTFVAGPAPTEADRLC